MNVSDSGDIGRARGVVKEPSRTNETRYGGRF